MLRSGLSKQIAAAHKGEVIHSNELSETDTEGAADSLIAGWGVVRSKLTKIEDILAVKESVCERDAYDDRVITATEEFIGEVDGMFSAIQSAVRRRHPLTERLIELFKNSVDELTVLSVTRSEDGDPGQTGGAGKEIVPASQQPACIEPDSQYPIIYKPSIRHEVSKTEKCVACIMVLFQIGLVFLLMWVLSGPLQGGIRIMEFSTKAVGFAEEIATQIGSTLPTCTPEELNDPLLDRRADGVYTYRTPDQEVRGYFTTKTIPGGKIIERCMERSRISSFFSQGAGAVSDTVSIAKVVIGGALGVCSCGMATVIIVKVLDYIQRYGSSIVCQILALTALMNGRIDFNGFRLGMEMERQKNRSDFEELQMEFNRPRIPQVSDRQPSTQPATQPPALEDRPAGSRPMAIPDAGDGGSSPFSGLGASSPSISEGSVQGLFEAKQAQLARTGSLRSQDSDPSNTSPDSLSPPVVEPPTQPSRGGGSYTKSKSRRKYKRRKTNQCLWQLF